MTYVKICGLTTLEDALAAVTAGADLLGFNFYRKSPRYIEPEICRAIAQAMRRTFPALTLVGIFVNEAADDVKRVMDHCGLDLAQLHGDETPEAIAAMGGRAYKAIRPPPGLATGAAGTAPDFVRRFASGRAGLAPAILIDAAVPGQYGGSGRPADWPLARAAAAQFPLLLAGGLTPGNVGEAVRQVRPWGVDVSSGVEASPGRKDPEKLKAFVRAIRRKDGEGSAELPGQSRGLR